MKFHFKKIHLLVLCTVLFTALFTASLIYLTPLKNIALIQPTYNDESPKDFYTRYKENPDQFIFIDVRDPNSYKNLHAEGSTNMPLNVLYDQRKNLPKNGKEIVLICSGGRLAGVGYMYLEHYGHFNLTRIEGGIENWISENLPTVSSGL